MKKILHILIVEDSDNDVLMVLHQIKKGGYEIEYERVESPEAMKNTLKEKDWDIILSDYTMPRFNGLDALTILQESGKDIPFIIISGTIGEEVAVECMKAGANDYIMKNNLMRLVTAVERELAEAKNRAELKRLEQEQKLAEKQIIKLNRIYAVLSNINQAIVRIHEKQELFNEACRITVEDGKFCMAWIGVMNSNTNKIDIAAYFGASGNYLGKIDIDLNDELLNSDTARTAIETGMHKIENNIQHNEKMIIRRENAMKYDCKSSAAFPLKIFDKVAGVFNIYSNETDFFDDDDIKLIDEIAKDISFAMEFIETENERKQTEKALRESEERFRRLTENARDIIYRMSLSDGKYEYISPATYSLLGYYPEEFYANQSLFLQIIHPDWHSYYEEQRINLLKGEMPPTYEYQIIHKSGEVRWLNQRNILIRDKNEKPVAIEGIVTDITKSKVVEEALRESESHLRTLINTIPDLIWLKDTEGVYLSCNGKFECFFGAKESEIIGKTDYDFVDKELADFFRKHDRIAMSAGKPTINEEWVTFANDGHQACLETTKTPMLDKDGQIIGILGIGHDITERKHTQDTLRNSEERYKKAQTMGHVGNWEYNLQTTEFWGSSEAKLIYGFDPNQRNFTTDEVENCIPERESVHQALVDLIEKGKPYNLEFEIHPRNSLESKIIASIAELQCDENGNPLKVIGVVQDITERKQAEKQIIKLNRIYAVLSNVNQTIVRVHDIKELFSEVCRITVEYGKFRMAWIGMVNLQTNKVDVAASNGISGDYLKEININLNDEFQSSGPTGLTIKSGMHKIANNIQHDDNMAPWRENAIKYDYKSSATFPLKVFDKVVGAFNIYSNEMDFFDEDDIKLLDEMAIDISFALEFIESKNERELAEQNLKKSESKLRSILDNIGIGIALISPKMEILELNTRMSRWFPAIDPGKKPICYRSFNDPPRDEICGYCPTCKTLQDGLVHEALTETPHEGIINNYRIISSPIFSTSGKVLAAIEMVEDITERKRIEKELEKFHAILGAIIEAAPTAIFDLDLDGNVKTVWNPAAEKLLGWNKNEVLGRPLPTVPADKQEEFKHFREQIKNGLTLNGVEVQRIKRDGTPIDYCIYASPMYDAKNKIIGNVAVLVDITERKQAERRQDLFLKILKHLNDKTSIEEIIKNIVIEIKQSTGFEAVGIRLKQEEDFPYYTTNGFSDDFVIAEKFLCGKNNTGKIIYDSEGKISYECLCGYILNKKNKPEKTFFTKNGSFWTNNSTFLLKNSSLDELQIKIRGRCIEEGYKSISLLPLKFKDQIIGLVQINDHRENCFTIEMIEFFEGLGSSIGIAIERKNTEESLKFSEERFRKLVQSVTDYIYTVKIENNEAVSTLHGPGCIAVTGYSSEEFYKDNYLWFNIIHKDDRTAVMDIINKIIFGDNVKSFEHRIIHKDGEIRWVSNTPVVLKTDKGEVFEYDGLIRDITERKRAEDDLSKYKDHLEDLVEERTNELTELSKNLKKAKEESDQANKAKSIFLANMSHEIRTPLNTILGYSQLLSHDPLIPDDKKRNLEIINKSGEHLLKIINDILEISKIEAGRIKVKENDFDLHLLLINLYNMFKIQAEKKDIKFYFVKTKNFPQYIISDEKKISQIIINLLSNALKFTEKGNITLKADAKINKNNMHYINISVKDTGIGISDKEIENIFEPFVQLDNGSQIKTGTGLGLSICKEFIEILDGEYNLKSQIGKGSMFSFTIPVKLYDGIPEIKNEKVGNKYEKKTLKAGQKSPTILIAEDNEANRNFLKLVLNEVGFKAIEAVNGRECITQFNNLTPDLIIMDNRMPIKTGVDAIKEIRLSEKGRKVPIIILSASAFEENVETFKQAGADEFLLKPVKISDLLYLIKKHLNVEYENIDKKKIVIEKINKNTIKKQILELDENIKREILEAAQKLEYNVMKEITEKHLNSKKDLKKYINELIDNYDFENLEKLFK